MSAQVMVDICCDVPGCNGQTEGSEWTHREARQRAKDEGWGSAKVGGGRPKDLCPDHRALQTVMGREAFGRALAADIEQGTMVLTSALWKARNS